jgi:hypothetical protein
MTVGARHSSCDRAIRWRTYRFGHRSSCSAPTIVLTVRTTSHQNAAVKWLPTDHRFQCTKHDSECHPDGIHTAGRATRNLDRFAVRRDGEFVVADLNRLFQSDKQAALWASAAISV